MAASHERGTFATSPQPLVLSGHTRMVYTIAFLPDGTQFVSGSMDGTVRTWGTEQGREIRSPINCNGIVSTVAVSNDGRWIATEGEKWSVVLWNAATHEKVGESGQGHLGHVECLSFSADGTQVVSGAGDTTVVVWRVPTGERLAGPFRGHVDAVTFVVFSPDGDRFASTDLKDVRIRDSQSGTLVLPLIELQVWSLAWAPAPNDRLLYAACDTRIVCIDALTGAVCLEWTAHPLTITCIALSRDGQLIAPSSNYAKTVQLWSTATQQECTPALQHSSYVRCVAVSPDGSHVISGGEDHTVYIWPIRDNLARIEEAASQSTTVCDIHHLFKIVEDVPRQSSLSMTMKIQRASLQLWRQDRITIPSEQGIIHPTVCKLNCFWVANAFRTISPIMSLGTVMIQSHLVDSRISTEGHSKRMESPSRCALCCYQRNN
jgi:WD40 repeat protein